MNKKKLVISILVVIMILSLALTALVGCKKDKGKNYVELSKDVTLEKALGDALYNTAKDNNIDSLKASAELNVSTKYGDAENKYRIKLGTNLVLNPDYTDKSNLGVSVTDAKNNTNILNVYYSDSGKDNTSKVYVDLGDGNDAQHFALKGVSVSGTLNSAGKKVDPTQAAGINEGAVEGISGIFQYLDMVAGMASDEDTTNALKQADDGSEIVLTLDLAKILGNASSVLSMLDTFTEGLGLKLKGEDLATTLPALKIDLVFKMSGGQANNYKNAKIVGIEAKLDAKSKDMVIKRANDSNFVRVNIAKDFSADVSLDFVFGSDAAAAPTPLVANNLYKNTSAINFTAEGELELKEQVGVSLNVNGNDITVAILEGTYSIKIGADIDPTQLISMQFSKPEGTQAILNLVSNIATKVINVFSLQIESKDDPTLKLDVSLRGGMVSAPSLSLLGELGTTVQPLINNKNLATAINAIAGLFPEPGSGDDSGAVATAGETESGDATAAILASIKPLIDNLTVIVNDGKINVTVNNHTVNKNSNGLADTTIDVTAEASKSGIEIVANILNIVLNAAENRTANISAKVEVNDNGVTVTAKSATKLDGTAAEIDFGGGITMKIDLVLKLTKFELGNCQ